MNDRRPSGNKRFATLLHPGTTRGAAVVEALSTLAKESNQRSTSSILA
jgi:hypothetical protein